MTIPRYYPFLHGEYDVKVGIYPLGKDFSNAAVDGQVFQIDGQHEVYRQAKRAAAERASHHVLRDELGEEAERDIANWMAERLDAEHPSRASGLSLADAGLDAVALEIQEDFAVLQIDADGSNRMAYLNIAMPSGWAPEVKIGRPFDVVHAPVPRIGPINAKQGAIARMMVNATKGAVRFAWTITTDAALNHHPRRDPCAPAPSPLPDHPEGQPLLRVERQVIRGFADHQAALFLIRTYLYGLDTLDGPTRSALASAVSGMSDASLRYKNMDRASILKSLA